METKSCATPLLLLVVLFLAAVCCLDAPKPTSTPTRTAAPSPAGNKVLVLVKDEDQARQFSALLGFIKESGYSLDVVIPDKAPPLSRFGQWTYDHLISLYTEYEFDKTIVTQGVIDFIDGGHNVFLTGTSESAFTEIAEECGVGTVRSDTDSVVMLHDHAHHFPNEVPQIAITHVNEELEGTPFLEAKELPPVVYRGACLAVADLSSPLHTRVLLAEDTAYCAEARHSRGVVGAATSASALIVALQARNNARVILSGSAEMCSDTFFAKNITGEDGTPIAAGNKELCESLIKWVFQENGALRLRDVTYKKVDGVPDADSDDDMLTIKDTIEYGVVIEEWDASLEKWVPFEHNDVQLEVTMLNPYIRLTLEHKGEGVHHARFMMPDVYGVFTLRIDYKRAGYSWLESEVRVPVRPFRHNQYPRFIDFAYPYYIAAFSMIAGVVLFAFVFLFQDPKKTN